MTWALETFAHIAEFPCPLCRKSAEHCPSTGTERKWNLGHFCHFYYRTEGRLQTCCLLLSQTRLWQGLGGFTIFTIRDAFACDSTQNTSYCTRATKKKQCKDSSMAFKVSQEGLRSVTIFSQSYFQHIELFFSAKSCGHGPCLGVPAHLCRWPLLWQILEIICMAE